METSTEIAADGELAKGTAAKPNVIRRLYDWCLSWAESPFGTPALAVISFTESSFFPIPPDLLQIALSVAKPRRSFFYAGISAIFSVLGGVLGWMIGSWAWFAVSQLFFDYVPGFTPAVFDHVRDLYHENAFLYIVLSAFTPIPFKVFTIASGVFGVNLGTLVVASAIGRSTRFFLVAATIFIFGPKVKDLIDKYFNLATVALGVLFVGGFLIIKYLG